ncbi:MAG TPA: peptidoglycan bridge formation glycyltransferase FemA/FemB family protein [Candidatus Limnocylindrales bacterium]|nr:peptidoglycan bridge formation glycyltransferase FemA/FemB family protein [Candidatus Limnocylindrales bacterium]
MHLRPAEEADGPAWQSLLEASTTGDFLHDWEWAAVTAFDGQPQRRFLLEEDGRVTGIAAAQVRRIGRGRSFWYVPHGPVMDFDGHSARDRVQAIIGGLHAAARADGAIAVRVEPRLPAGSPALAHFAAVGLRPVEGHLQVGHTRILELGPDDEMLARLDKDTRYSVRRAEREGVQVSTSGDPDDQAAIDALYELSAITQQRAGFPLRPRERFHIAWRVLAGAGRAWIMQASHDGRMLASAMLIREGVQSFYFLAGSLREEPGERKVFASHALQWALMRHARDHGARRHDLWGIAPPDSGPDHPWAGVGLFKKGFGGEPVAWAGMWDLVVDPLAYRLRELAQPLLGMARRLTRR